uniref:BY PROTMAP: gi/472585261/gb/EMS22815.1/ RNA polymerase II-associated protein 1 [Rhodosporidium toruloides NP11] n=1 Tax=Rhodotorula toruloides TaxID=5286 RepID=A0A0K3CLD1_RHOTO
MAQRIRPSLADLSDYDQPAFLELDAPAQPAAQVMRTRPPTVASSLPPPIPVIQPSSSTAPSEPEAKPQKPKSRFALQREKEAAAAAQRAPPTGAERFELSLDELDAEVAEQEEQLPRRDIVKDVLERPTSQPKPPSAPGPSRPSPLAPGGTRPTGFPAPGRGVFPRKSQPSAPTSPSVTSTPSSSGPRIFRTSSLVPPTPTSSSLDAASLTSDPADSISSLLSSVSRENEDVVSRMSESEILEEQRQIREEMGLSEGVLRMLQMRGERRRGEVQDKGKREERESRPLPVERKEEVKREEGEEEEGSPEYIRRHFFPNEPPNPALDWTRPVPPPSTSSSSTPASLQTRTFDLSGAPIASSPATDSPEATLSTDHHVSSSTTFTISSLLALTGSSVPSQRSTALTILERIIVRSRAEKGEEKEWEVVRIEYLKLTGCLAPFAPTEPVLAPDWPLCALDELLRSATSPVFQRLPDGWDSSELELVQTSLALMRVVCASSSVQRKPDPPTLLFDLIKVFMLEKDNGTTTGTSGATAEVFRDEAVQRSMTALLEPLAIGHSRSRQLLKPDTRTSDATTEGVSARLSTAPFYQLFTDLVGLYDSISLSDRLFGLVLLPPLAMSYPVDYRRLIWTDYAHILRHLRFTVDEAISDVPPSRAETAIASYLEPRETNEALLMAYVDALASGAVSLASTPFLHFVALHHVASAVFVDEADSASTTAAKLVKALLARRAGKVLQQVLRYRQAEEGVEVKVPPACFDADEASMSERRQWLRMLVGDGGAQQLDALLEQ